jgi:hypothetical protein
MKQQIRRRLVSLASGEFVAICVLAFFLWRIRDRYGATAIGPLALLGFATLVIILLEGTGYWLVMLRRLGRPSHETQSPATVRQRVTIVRALYAANGILLLIFPLVYLIRAIGSEIDWQTGDPWFGLGLYLFAVGEFVHYFVVKIVRNDRATRNTRQPSRFRRELAH